MESFSLSLCKCHATLTIFSLRLSSDILVTKNENYSLQSYNKKLSYRRETARQLCTSKYLGWLTDRAMHPAQNTAESQRLYYFWHSNALIQEFLAENGFCREIATPGHSFCNLLPADKG